MHFGLREFGFIRGCALNNPRCRARICVHKESTDTLHEMLIIMRTDSHIRPHTIENKVE